MTVSYSREVDTTKLGTFLRLLFRWKGSIYRIIYREMVIYLCLYYFVCVLYQYIFTNRLRKKFEDWSLFWKRYTDVVPLTFVLGFYVSIIVGRWWNTFLSLNWPDRVCFQVQCLIHGQDERGRMIRRTAARYINLSQVLVLRDISSAVRKRFPTLNHLLEAGFFTEEELEQYESSEMAHNKFWVPLQWTCSLLTSARKEALIDSDPLMLKMIEEVLQVRNNLTALLCYDWISVPLVYTQVVTIAVYSYFLACLFSRQYLISQNSDNRNGDGGETDMYFPLFTLLQFVFYMGWLKVAESIMNPLGEDDDDFEDNYLIDRNLQVAYFIVDDNCMKIPPLKRDFHWNEPEANVPHTEESAGLKNQPYVPSAALTQLQTESDLKTSRSNTSVTTVDSFSRKHKNSTRQNSICSAQLAPYSSSEHAFADGSHKSNLHTLKRLVSSVSRKISSQSQFQSQDCESQPRYSNDEHDTTSNGPLQKKVGSNWDSRSTIEPFIIGCPSSVTLDSKHILSPVSEVANEETEASAQRNSVKPNSFEEKVENNLLSNEANKLPDDDDGLIMFADDADAHSSLLTEKDK